MKHQTNTVQANPASKPRRMSKIYIAGPYSRGDTAVNVRNAILAGESVRALGHTPFIPHLTHFWHLISPHEYRYWMELDFEWLRECDAMLRLPGESSGADEEESIAREIGIPVYYSIENILG